MSAAAMIFEPDPDSNGWSIEIYAEPDETGGMEYLGRIDLFARVMYVEGARNSWYIPKGIEGKAIEAWATAILVK